MADVYESLTRFVRKYMVDPGLAFNQLDTTYSAVNSILRRFEDCGWIAEEVMKPESQHARHKIISPNGRLELSMNSAKVFRHPMHTEKICQRKHLTERMLEYHKIATPLGADFPHGRGMSRKRASTTSPNR